MKQRFIHLMVVAVISLMALTSVTNAAWLGIFGSRHHTTAVVAASGRPGMERTRIRGRVVRVTGQVAYVRVSPVRTVVVRLGPESYWEAQGYAIEPGEYVTVSGWCDPEADRDLFFAAGISGPGFRISLTNDEGVPLWVTEDVYVSGWHPTYDRYTVWYEPSYHYIVHERGAPPGYAKSVPPGQAKKREHERIRGK